MYLLSYSILCRGCVAQWLRCSQGMLCGGQMTSIFVRFDLPKDAPSSDNQWKCRVWFPTDYLSRMLPTYNVNWVMRKKFWKWKKSYGVCLLFDPGFEHFCCLTYPNPKMLHLPTINGNVACDFLRTIWAECCRLIMKPGLRKL